MANQEHLDILKQGVEVWNRWRQEHPKIPPDLSEADLEKANLSGINLRGTYTGPNNLCLPVPGIPVVPTTLRNANLRKANLRGADLSRVDLREADLGGADLSEGDLSDNDNVFLPVYGATLTEANLTGANLSGADLSGTVLSGTVFAHVDLRSVKGLAEIRHRGPSIVQLHTVQLPQDGSTLHFLRGTGLSDEWIDFSRASMMHPIMYYSCFISYSSKDQDFAEQLYADLQSKGVRCWFAPHDAHRR